LLKHSAFASFLKMTCVIIWDECSMQHRHALKAVNHTLQDICDCHHPFGGILLVLGGDFLQTLPIVSRGSCSDIVHACILSLPLWPFVMDCFGSGLTHQLWLWLSDYISHGQGSE
jgi:hypothetical protein